MAKEFAKEFYRSTAWRKTRAAYFKSKLGTCEQCKRPGLIVHHIKEITTHNINDQEITLNNDNLQLLCLECHNRAHGSQTLTVEGLFFDANGDLQSYERRKKSENTPPVKKFGGRQH